MVRESRALSNKRYAQGVFLGSFLVYSPSFLLVLLGPFPPLSPLIVERRRDLFSFIRD